MIPFISLPPRLPVDNLPNIHRSIKTRMVIPMKFDDIYGFFRNPPPLHLNQELAVCYILDILLQGDSYGTELIGRLERESAMYRLSDTVLYSAIKFLETSGAIVGYWKKVEGRGRPRRMYRIQPEWESQCRELAYFWHQYANVQPSLERELQQVGV
jgi:DNA-binding PadR family transcriptional regulator